MRYIRFDNYIIEADIMDILNRIKLTIANGKLKDIRQKGENILVTCPHHNGGHEDKPAMNIYVGDDEDIDYGYARCFACGFEGPFYKFVAECFDNSDEYAKAWLAKNFGRQVVRKFDLGENIILGKKRLLRGLNDSMDASVLSAYQSYCPYLAKRNLSRDTCSKFNVKYDPKFRQVVFPCYDVKGNLIMLPKRSIDTKTFYLDAGRVKPVYCLDNIIKNRITAAIVTEGPFDTLIANQYGFPAVGTFGKIDEHQVECLNHSGLRVVYAMFDNDNAGRDFTAFLKAHLDPEIMLVEVKIPDPYKDIGELDYETFWKILEKYR